MQIEETNLKKYGSIGACKGKTSEFIKKRYEADKIEYDNIIDLYSKDDVNKLLNSDEFFYKKYFLTFILALLSRFRNTFIKLKILYINVAKYLYMSMFIIYKCKNLFLADFL